MQYKVKQLSSNKQFQAFFALVRAGLWANANANHNANDNLNHNLFEGVDWGEVYRLAEEQSVIGLVAAGIEELRAKSCSAVDVPQEWALQFIGQTLQIEQRNKAMNAFVAELIERLRKADIYAILVKGQGIAQCYEKPLWRSSGDIDLFLSEDNYNKAKQSLVPIASTVEEEDAYTRHLGMTINGFEVELHGNLRSGLSNRIDKVLDNVASDVFYGGNVRSWMNGRTQVFLMGTNNDVVYVFTHILQHFFKGGIGLRQICDWCRLMWTYRDALDLRTIELRLRKAGLMSEWKVFFNLASRYLGMPDLDSGLMAHDSRYDKKADRVISMIFETGNFGHNRDESYRQKYSGFKKRAISVWRYTKEALQHFMIFPMDSLRVWFRQMRTGLRVAVRGE